MDGAFGEGGARWTERMQVRRDNTQNIFCSVWWWWLIVVAHCGGSLWHVVLWSCGVVWCASDACFELFGYELFLVILHTLVVLRVLSLVFIWL